MVHLRHPSGMFGVSVTMGLGERCTDRGGQEGAPADDYFFVLRHGMRQCIASDPARDLRAGSTVVGSGEVKDEGKDFALRSATGN